VASESACVSARDRDRCHPTFERELAALTEDGCLAVADIMPDGIEVVVEAEEADHVHGFGEARLVDVNHGIRTFGEEHIHQLISACRNVLEPVPAAMLCCSAAHDRVLQIDSGHVPKPSCQGLWRGIRLTSQSAWLCQASGVGPRTHLMFAGLKAPAMPLRTSRHHSSVSPLTRSGCPLDPIICVSQRLPIKTSERALRKTAQPFLDK